MSEPFSQLSARQRAAGIVDRGSFSPINPADPTLPFVVGTGTAAGRPVLVALGDGHVRGGTVGVHEAELLVRLADLAERRVRTRGAVALVLGFDTGGVRVDEGPVALAAVSAVGVALTRLTLLGVRAMSVISGPRGCFGAPAVMAALPERVVMTENARWGLTGPKLFGGGGGTAPDAGAGTEVTCARTRLHNGDAHAVVADDVGAVREQVAAFARDPGEGPPALHAVLAAARETAATLRDRLLQHGSPRGLARTLQGKPGRDLLRYSFRGQWKADGPSRRSGLVHAALGTLGGRPALGLIIGPEEIEGGMGIEEASLITEMIEKATSAEGPPAPILTFLFCQGHAVDLGEERFGLPRALAQCLRAMMAAKMRGHPIVTVLGGGAYGAAYLTLAAPSHRILAMRGTSVAPMAPRVYEAFQKLRGRTEDATPETQLAELIPEVRSVESVIRLPRALREELGSLLGQVDSGQT